VSWPTWGLRLRTCCASFDVAAPALCNVAVTNSCNATCDFCNFANGKVERKDLRWIDADQFDAALQILHDRGVRYVSFFGGEPLLHPRLSDMIAMSVTKGMGPALITNGWLLSSKLDQLASAGLKTVYVSIDAPSMSDHEKNRGLKGLGERIRKATLRMPMLGMTALAQVTMSKLIDDYRALVPLLQQLGFEAVAFSYPQRTRLGSSSLAWSAESNLMKFTDSELVQAFEAVDNLRNAFPVNNPRASIADMKRRAGTLRLLRRLQEFLYGLEFRCMALRCLGRTHVLGLGVCEYSARARRLHGMHSRLLPRPQRDASFCGVAWRCIGPLK